MSVMEGRNSSIELARTCSSCAHHLCCWRWRLVILLQREQCSNSNNASPCKGGSLTKRGGQRKSPTRGLGGIVLRPLSAPLPPALQVSHSITSSPPLQCRGIYDGYFGFEQVLTFAAKSMQSTANQLQPAVG